MKKPHTLQENYERFFGKVDFLKQTKKYRLIKEDYNDIISSCIEELVKEFEKYGTLRCDINKGQCMVFQDNLYEILKDKGIEVDTLSDAMFYDAFDDYDADEYAVPEDYGTEPKWDYKELGMPSHYWIYYKGKHYDAESPNGESNFFNLTAFKDFYEKYVKKVQIQTKDKLSPRHTI
jgi:hypothetical protein